jgi:hypothetical protein
MPSVSRAQKEQAAQVVREQTRLSVKLPLVRLPLVEPTRISCKDYGFHHESRSEFFP